MAMVIKILWLLHWKERIVNEQHNCFMYKLESTHAAQLAATESLKVNV